MEIQLEGEVSFVTSLTFIASRDERRCKLC